MIINKDTSIIASNTNSSSKNINLCPLGSFAFLHIYFQTGSLKRELQPSLQQHTNRAASSNSGNHLLVNHLLSTSVARNPHIGPFLFDLANPVRNFFPSHSQMHTTNATQHVKTLLCWTYATLHHSAETVHVLAFLFRQFISSCHFSLP